MPSTYSSNLKIELQANGENAATWGDKTNTNLGTALEQAIVGYATANFTSDANLTLPYTDTSTSQVARALVLNVTSAVSLTVTRELIVPTIQKQYIVQNNTTGSQSITVKTSAGSGVTIPSGRKMHVYVDGTNVIQMFDFVTTLSMTNLSYTGTLTGGTGIVNIGSGQFYKDASGNVGIGTASPAQRLHVNGDIQQENANYLRGKLAAGTATRLFGLNAANSLYVGGIDAAQSETLFVRGGTEQMRLDASGNLGIGTASPGARLDVVTGTARWRITNDGSGDVVEESLDSAGTAYRDLNSYALNHILYTSGSERMRLDSSGNLGIGTASPAYRLDVAASVATLNVTSTSTTAGNQPTLRLQHSGNNVFQIRGGADLQFLSDDGANERMRLTNAGNLGIGTASPGSFGQFATNTSGTPTLAYASILSAAGVYGAGFESTFYVGAARTDIVDNGNIAGYRIKTSTPNSGSATLVFEACSRATGSASPPNVFTERMRLDSSGRLLVKTTATQNAATPNTIELGGNGSASGDQPSVIVKANTGTTAANTGYLTLTRSRGTTDNAATIVAADDRLGMIRFSGANGTGFDRAAEIYAEVDGTPGASSDMPGRIVFATTADGSATPTERMRLDASGNLGLGVTPSAWSGVGGVFEIKGNAYIYSATGVLSSGANAFFNGTNWIYKTTQAVTRYEQVNGQHQWSYAASGTAGNTITFTQAMTLDSSGNLGIGTASPSYRLDVVGASTIPARFKGNGTISAVILSDNNTVTEGYVGSVGDDIRIVSGSQEVVRARSSGSVTAGIGNRATNATDGFLYVPTCAGTPTGTPTAITGFAPIVINTTNNKLYFYSGGAWRDAGP